MTNVSEVKEPVCCGLGGSFSIKFSKTSEKIQKKNINALLSTSPDVIVTSCPGCMMQIKDGLHREKNKTEVKHLIEVVAENL